MRCCPPSADPETERPRDSAEPVGLEPRGLEHVDAVTERGGEHAAPAVVARPGQGVLARHSRLRVPVERELEMHPARVVALELLDLVDDAQPRADPAGRRVVRVLLPERHRRLRAVTTEFPAEHVQVAGVAVERVGGGVHPDEAVTLRDPRRGTARGPAAEGPQSC